MSFKNITFILHKPQLSENIGACARALKNFNFNNLSIVNPKPSFQNDKIIATFVGAKDIIKKAIKGMLPNSALFRDLMKNNLKLYKDSNHPHESQNPNTIDFKSQNRKNLINV